MHPKNKLIIHFFLNILQFKEPWNLIGWQHFGPLPETQNFYRYSGDINSNVSLHFKFFKQSKKSYFGAILDHFWPNFGKNKFSWKKELCQFLKISIIFVPLCIIKNQKKLMSHSWEKYWTVGQIDNSDFIGLSLGRDPIIKTTLSFPEFVNKFIDNTPKTSLFHWFLREIQPILESCDQSGTTIYDHTHPKIFQSTFNFNEFVITCKKSGFFNILLKRHIWFKNPPNLIGLEHFGPYFRNQNFPKYEICPSVKFLI